MKKVSISLQHGTRHIVLDHGVTDIVKLLCCILVASSHYAQHYIHVNGTADTILNIISSQGGYLGVSVFFFLSGFGLMSSLMKRDLSFLEFARKRVTKVYLPAVFVSVIWIICLCLFPAIPQDELNVTYHTSWSNIITRVIGTFFFRFADSVLWFVGIIIILYAVIYLYNRLRTSCHNTFRLPFLIISIVAVTALAYITVAPFASVSISAFALGAITAEYNGDISRCLHTVCLSFIIICLLSGYVFHDNMIMIHGLINYISITLWVWISGLVEIKVSNVPHLLSDASYDIYLTHKKVLVVLTMVWPDIALLSFIAISIIISIIELYLRKLFRTWILIFSSKSQLRTIA